MVAATSEEGRVVTNGMSQYSRNERNANAGIVVGIEPKDYPGYPENPLAGMEFQRVSGKRVRLNSVAATTTHRRNWLATLLPASPAPHWAALIPSYKPGVTPTDLVHRAT